MLDTTRALGARELSLTTPTACTAASPSSSGAAAAAAAAAAVLHGSPVESEGTEFFDAYDTLPWSPERAVPSRQSPATMAARRMQLALWPDAEEVEAAVEKPRQGWDVFNSINSTTSIAASSGPLSAEAEEPKAAMRSKAASLSSLFPSTETSPLQSQGWKVIDSNVCTGATAGSIPSSPRLQKPGVASPDRVHGAPASRINSAGIDVDAEAESAAAAAAAAAAADRPRRGRTTESSTRTYSRSLDSGEDVDDSSTVSGTTVTEEGWLSGQGSEGEGAVASRLALGRKGNRYGNEAQTAAAAAAAAPSKLNSLRRVLDSARTLNTHNERRLRKMMSMGTRRRAHTVAAAAAPPPAPAPATRVKSRTSSSFSVQCATSPKVATVAVFFPPAALDAACEAAAGAGCSAAAAAAGVGAGTAGENLGKGAGIAKGWRATLHRSPSSPPEATGGDGSHGEAGGNGGHELGGGGAVQATRRRWSFAGQARFGPKTQAHQATQCTSKGQGASSCSSPPLAGQQAETRTTGPSAEPPDEGTTLGDRTAAAAAALEGTESSQAHPSVWGWGSDVRRYRARGGSVQAIVSADYNGEVKVFVGFAGGIEGSG